MQLPIRSFALYSTMLKIQEVIMLGKPVESQLYEVVVSLDDAAVVGQVVSDSGDQGKSGILNLRLKDGSERRLRRGDLRKAIPSEKNEFLHNNLHLAISGQPTAIPAFGS